DDDTNHRDLSCLELGAVDSLALPYETYKLAFTQSLLDQIFTGRGVDEDLLGKEGRYVSSQVLKEGWGFPDTDGDDTWWIPSGRQGFVPEQFYLPNRMQDPFGQVYRFTYDEYSLLVAETHDPLENRVTIGERDREGAVLRWGNNYRVMQPWLITDPNGNRAQVAFDTLGLVAGTAVMGKVDDPKP
ncbi:hypothetical protein, partial [Haemophilus parainfluenzae]|uniref:hypothetical protein n=1 Tax=Haemophilus parainfluenzae TaxID=729 RepID=UPI00124BAEA4